MRYDRGSQLKDNSNKELFMLVLFGYVGKFWEISENISM